LNMKKILVPIADGFEEIETATIVDVLRRAGHEVVVASIQSRELLGSRKMRFTADVLLKEVKNKGFDAIVLPGGQPGVNNLRSNPEVLAMLQSMHREKRLIAAICAAALVLQDAGLLKGKNFTCYPGVEKNIQEGRHKTDRVVVDGELVTSRAPRN